MKDSDDQYNYLNQLTFIDLFCGIGGFRLALEYFGAKCVYSSDWDEFAQQTYNHNFNEIPKGDITQISAEDIPRHDVLCAGFPCQAFSVSGKQGGFSDTRGTLFFDIARIAAELKPKVIFLENVRNFVRHDSGRTFLTVKNVLTELGYRFFYAILDSSHFGVPQHRPRVYIVCFRDDINIKNFIFPKPTYQEINLNDILENDIDTSDYEIDRTDIVITGNKKLVSGNLVGGKLLQSVRVGTISKGGQGERIYSPYGHAITLSAYGGGIAAKTGAYLINGVVRRLTTRECLRIQGFPENYSFPGHTPQGQIYKMCGNSVSVPVIKRIFEQIQAVVH